MNNITDERLHRMLSEFYQAEPERIPSFHPFGESAPTPMISVYSFKDRKNLVIAASMVFAFLLSLSAFFFFRNKNRIPIAQSPDVFTAVSSTFPTGEATSQNETGTETESFAPTQAAATELSTDASGNVVIIIRTVTSSESIDPAEENSSDSNERDHLDPTEKKSDHSSEKETDTPSSETKEPTETSAETSKPAGEIPEVEGSAECYAQFPLSLLYGSEQVYCRLTDQSGNPIGDSDLFSDQHIAYQSRQSDGTVYVVYYLSNLIDSGVDLPDGTYHFYFYGDSGAIAYHGIIHFIMY